MNPIPLKSNEIEYVLTTAENISDRANSNQAQRISSCHTRSVESSIAQLSASAVSLGFSPHYLLPCPFSAAVLDSLFLSLQQSRLPVHRHPNLLVLPTTVRLAMPARLLRLRCTQDYLTPARELISEETGGMGNLICEKVESRTLLRGLQ